MQMFNPVRVVATIVFIATVGLVFVGAFVIRISVSRICVLQSGRRELISCCGTPQVLCIIFVIIEYLAYTWYCLSYIPYARTAIKNMIGF
jgi:hypothetical protein